MHWKIKRDKFYSELFIEGGDSLVEKAGFFYDTSSQDVDIMESLKILCTPFTFVNENLKFAKNPCVLLSTGSFSPLHSGHIDMMYLAKEKIEKEGFQVVAGYFSPGHDEYVLSKVNEEYDISLRIKLAQRLISDHGWLMIDPWEGVFNSVAVNFTDVIIRLEAYLEKYLGKKIPVFFVSGSDNARFSLTFKNFGNCVIVKRPGYDFSEYLELFADSNRVLFTEKECEKNSSTEVRKGIVPFHAKIPLELRCENYDSREDEIITAIQSNFEKVNLSYFSKEKPLIEKMLSEIRVTVSLDSLFESDYNLRLSRCFDIGGLHSLGFSNRPGYPALEDQALPTMIDCDLYDDDIHSGNTMKFAEALLRQENCSVIRKISLRNTSSINTEVLDARDFLVGEHNSGLVLKFYGKAIRAPYVYPYVSPVIRCSINSPIEFSMKIWKINADHFSKNPKTLREIPYPEIFLAIGFSLDDSLEKICNWHYIMLSNFVNFL